MARLVKNYLNYLYYYLAESNIGYVKLENNLIAKIRVIGERHSISPIYDISKARYRTDDAEVLSVYHMDSKKIIIDNPDIFLDDDIIYYMSEEGAYWQDFIINMDKDYTGIVLTYHENGNLFSKEQYKNGNRNGTSKYYDDLGRITSSRQYLDGYQYGLSKKWNNGYLIEENSYICGKKHGTCKIFYENGKLKDVYNFEDDVLNGDHESRDINGNIMIKANYSKGKLEGTYYLYYPSGGVHFEIEYSKGIFNGKRISYNEAGNMLSIEHYINSKLIDIRKTWYKETPSQIKSITIYKDGKRNGVHREWSIDDILLVNENYENGLPIGTVWHYYENSNFKYRCKYENGIIVDEERWFEDGRLESLILNKQKR